MIDGLVGLVAGFIFGSVFGAFTVAWAISRTNQDKEAEKNEMGNH